MNTPAQALQMMGSDHPNAGTLRQCLISGQSFYTEHLDAQPTPAHYQAVQSFYQDIASLALTDAQVRAVVALHPPFRIKLAVYDGLGDTEVRDLGSDALALFLLRCPWPTYGDKVDSQAFTNALQTQARAMGWQVHESA